MNYLGRRGFLQSLSTFPVASAWKEALGSPSNSPKQSRADILDDRGPHVGERVSHRGNAETFKYGAEVDFRYDQALRVVRGLASLRRAHDDPK